MNELIDVELIKKYMKENNLTLNEFAEMCQVHAFAIEQLFDNDVNFSVELIKRIAFVMDICIFDLYLFKENPLDS